MNFMGIHQSRKIEDKTLRFQQGGRAYPSPVARLLRGKSPATSSGSAHP